MRYNQPHSPHGASLAVFYCLQLMIRLLTNGVKNQKFSSVTLRSTTENLTAALRAYNAALARAVYGATSVRAKSEKPKRKAGATLENAGCASTTHLSLSATAPLLAYALLTLGAVPSAARSNAAALRAAKKRVYLAACAAQASSAAPANRTNMLLVAAIAVRCRNCAVWQK